ncbi:predicted protein [Sclerotinia sclerotiorum 1980 UF-70]|uniref:Uncharacterized protein n=1 Tax=Sclerotinia sclerotiorum (strain ATCC 18683 / 1980 / Ss-1) TaxID=665079 RepID=A7ENW9_SCLS1|nr:predicted protein [Sclerotinia sclerotiorum 1980 UF-70]EDO04535.1 predicted protein [Sclerotinia sclerotiorum 1980 UF-70]
MIVIARPNEWARLVLMLNELLIDATTWRDASLDKVDVCKMDGPKREVDDHKRRKLGIVRKSRNYFLYKKGYRNESEILVRIEIKIDIVEVKGG